MKRLLLFALVVCLPVVGLAKKQHELQTAKVISQDIETQDRGAVVMPLYGGLVGVPISQRTNVVVLETSHHRLSMAEVGRRTIVLPVNGMVQFYQDGNWLIMVDSRGKKHKFTMLHEEIL